ncbi:MAG: hypothetical protein GX589_10015, partial [Deltaproteobacteria bacterium]|nr:hypothetical protein [Deltaproteobacteria bacterium]
MRRTFQHLSITFLVLFTLTPAAYSQSSYQYLTGAKSGKVVFIKKAASPATPAQTLLARSSAAPSDPVAAADKFIKGQAAVFGARNAAAELTSQSVETDRIGMTHIRYHQQHRGISVYGSEVLVHVGTDGEVQAANGATVPNIVVNPRARIRKKRAVRFAKALFSSEHPGIKAKKAVARLLVFNPGFINDKESTRSVLSWEVKLSSPNHPAIGHYFFNARTGELIYRSPSENRLTRKIYDCSYAPGGGFCHADKYSSQYNYYYGRSEGKPVRGPNPVKGTTDVDDLYGYWLPRAVQFYAEKFGRNEGNGRGGLGDGISVPLTQTRVFTYIEDIPWDCNLSGAYFSYTSISFCNYYLIPDIVGHEYSHGVAHYLGFDASGNPISMLKQWEPRALDENYADVAGEMFEYYLTGDNDWLSGGTAPFRTYRSLIDPPSVPRRGITPVPDRYMHEDIDCGTDGVDFAYINMGVPNKAAYLTAMGGEFNGCTITGLGREKMLQIWYRAISTYYTATTTFNEAYYALLQACDDLYPAADCAELKKALQATEMDQPGKCSGEEGWVPLCASPLDECPDDPDKTEPGVCGCGVPDIDTDEDGYMDCVDACPFDPNRWEEGECSGVIAARLIHYRGSSFG